MPAALDGSLHHSWTVDDVFKGRTFDFTKRFLPERIAGVELDRVPRPR